MALPMQSTFVWKQFLLIQPFYDQQAVPAFEQDGLKASNSYHVRVLGVPFFLGYGSRCSLQSLQDVRPILPGFQNRHILVRLTLNRYLNWLVNWKWMMVDYRQLQLR